jgi:hypothetical protein
MANTLRELLDEKLGGTGRSQADKLGWKYATFSCIVSGINGLSPSKLKDVCEKTGLPEEEIRRIAPRRKVPKDVRSKDLMPMINMLSEAGIAGVSFRDVEYLIQCETIIGGMTPSLLVEIMKFRRKSS